MNIDDVIYYTYIDCRTFAVEIKEILNRHVYNNFSNDHRTNIEIVERK